MQAITEETKFHKIESVFKKCEDNVKQLEHTGLSTESKNEEINTQILYELLIIIFINYYIHSMNYLYLLAL